MSQPGLRRVNPCPPLKIYTSRRQSRPRLTWGLVLGVALLLAMPAVLRPTAGWESMRPSEARAGGTQSETPAAPADSQATAVVPSPPAQLALTEQAPEVQAEPAPRVEPSEQPVVSSPEASEPRPAARRRAAAEPEVRRRPMMGPK